jgi:predicted TIM-barrel fold metal-dependent hydrolase
MTVIDVWMQHPTERLLEQEMFASLRRWTGSGMPTGAVPVEATVAAMDQAGVERGLICAWYGPDGPLISNDEVAAAVARHPDRFTGVASVDLRQPVPAVAELRRAVHELGFRGLRIVPWLWGLPPNHRWYYPLLTECVHLGIPFLTQVGHTGPLRTSETGRPIPYLDDVALDFPDLVIIAGHIGYPWTTEMISLATKYPNVYIDTSAYAAPTATRPNWSNTYADTADARSSSAPTTRCSPRNKLWPASTTTTSTRKPANCSSPATPNDYSPANRRPHHPTARAERLPATRSAACQGVVSAVFHQPSMIASCPMPLTVRWCRPTLVTRSS